MSVGGRAERRLRGRIEGEERKVGGGDRIKRGHARTSQGGELPGTFWGIFISSD